MPSSPSTSHTRSAHAFRASVLVLACVACGRDHVGEPAPPASIDELRSRIQRELDEAGLPGVGIAIVQRGEVFYAGGVGTADLELGTEITADTRFRVGSITKSLVALAILKLREDGKLSLEAKLADVAPEIAVDNPWEATHPVRVAHVLEHTAGFDDMHASELVNTGAPDVPLRDVLAVYPASRKPRWPPGTRMSYANPGYTVAGYLIEKVSGRPFEDYIHETLLVPMGMAGTSLRLPPEVEATLARGYDGARHALPVVSILHRPAGNLVASPTELAQLVRFFLHRGKVGDAELLSAASVSRAERNETLSYEGHRELVTQYGLGNVGEQVLGFVTHGHDGGIDGFASVYAYIPEQQVGWVVLFNSTARPGVRDRVTRLVAGFATRGLEPPPHPSVELPAASLAGVTGYYQLASPRQEQVRFMTDLLEGRTITLERGVLHENGLLVHRAALVPVSAGLFRRETEPGPSVLFTHAEDGTPAMIAGHAYFERASPWPHRLHLAVLIVALAIALSSIGYALVWGTRLAVNARFRSTGQFAVRGLPVLATLAAYGLLLCFQWVPRSILGLGTRNPATIAVFVLSIVYPALAVAALAVTIRAVRTGRVMNRGAKLHALLVAIANVVLCVYLLSWGFLAFRTWAS